VIRAPCYYTSGGGLTRHNDRAEGPRTERRGAEDEQFRAEVGECEKVRENRQIIHSDHQMKHGVSSGPYGGARTEHVHLEIDVVRRIETYDA